MVATSIDEQLHALREGRAFVRPPARAVLVSGADAETWLNDLVTAGVRGLPEGTSVRSLILSPTGRIRADLLVLRVDDGFVLVQGLDQPEAVDAILAPYVLSSDVRFEPAERVPVLVPSPHGWAAAVEPPSGALEARPEAAEAWRIWSGIAAFPNDLDTDALPAEGGLDAPPVTDTGKGCFLGQESVARVRNLGHPARLLLHLRADAAIAVGAPVLAEGARVGTVTSAAADADAGGSVLLARVRWDAREATLTTADGAQLRRA